eukprot:TRINITY_DN3426_c0_g2_i2.p1 TRINITY_DN3426_c0_g2~~TRINITY_DN3426_c0_g2_i2.p1  ORF type:complete len:114 (-),score=15.04 TRINITY_DN3426_c0_g2_i2:107-448(-)
MWSHGLGDIASARTSAVNRLLYCGQQKEPSKDMIATLNQFKIEYILFDLDLKEEGKVDCLKSYAGRVFRSYPYGYFQLWKVHPSLLSWYPTYESFQHPYHLINSTTGRPVDEL